MTSSHSADPSEWANICPGDTDRTLPKIAKGDPIAVVAAAEKSRKEWGALALEERIQHLLAAKSALEENQQELAAWITLETGKPSKEATGEMSAVIAKFDLSIEDAREFLPDKPVKAGPHPAMVRRRPLGVAAVVAPFNFPIHLGHGATLAYLLAGNPVIFKPSPLAANTGEAYGKILSALLPQGVFQILQGWSETAAALCMAPEVRAINFTGSIAAGKALAANLAGDPSKSLALELGGKNASLIFADADLPSAADAVAESMCLTCGQRCNATSRILVEAPVEKEFFSLLRLRLQTFQPGDPFQESTKLGPLIHQKAVDRYLHFANNLPGEILVAPEIPSRVAGKAGHYVTPSLVKIQDFPAYRAHPLFSEEAFSPVATLEVFSADSQAVDWINAGIHGLTTSIFTSSRQRFLSLANQIDAGNIYCNLPTTFSPSTLPFGGWKASGNGKPGGRGYVRFAYGEQSLQWKADSEASK